MIKKVKNVDSVEHTWCGMTIGPSGVYEISAGEYRTWKADEEIETAISDGKALIGNSGIFFVGQTAINYLQCDESICFSTLGYDGEGMVGRWLETHDSMPSCDSPQISALTGKLSGLTLSCETVTIATVELYVNGATAVDISLDSEKKTCEYYLDYQINSEDEISAKITSGTILKPLLGIYIRGV